MSEDKIGAETLEVMQKAKGYNNWLFSLLRPHLKGRILEAGAGIGNFSTLLNKVEELTAIDYQKSYIKSLKKKGIEAGFGDIEKGKYFFKNRKFNTVVNLNVLEHIEDDKRVLDNFYKLLLPGGKVLMITPAHRFAYSDIDKNLGHFRRYSKNGLENKFIKSGFRVIDSRYINILGLAGWFIAGKILGKKQLESSQLSIFNIISKPLLLLEKIIQFPLGLSVFIVAEKESKKIPIKKVSVIIPVYNEESTILEIISRVKRAKLPSKLSREIIVVNDGSTDKTADLLNMTKGINLIHKKNGGKGSAVIEGLKYTTGDVIIIQDADLEYNPKDYSKLIKPILSGKTNVVYGTRLRKLKLKLVGKGRTLHPQNYFANVLLSKLTNVLFQTKLTDMETCYKVFRKEVFNPLVLHSKSFELEPELTAIIAKQGEYIHEVDIRVTPRSYYEGKKIKPSDGVMAVRKLFEEKFLL